LLFNSDNQWLTKISSKLTKHFRWLASASCLHSLSDPSCKIIRSVCVTCLHCCSLESWSAPLIINVWLHWDLAVFISCSFLEDVKNGGFINICYLNIVFLYLRCNFIVEHSVSIPWNNFLYDFFLFLKSLIEGSDRLNLKNAYHSFIATHIAIYHSFCVLLITE